MAITKEQKHGILSELEAIVADAQAVTFAQFDGLSVQDTTSLRQQLREEGVGYKVAKKTLIKRAFEAANIEGNLPGLPGNIAVAWSNDDLTAPARGLHAFAEDGHNEQLTIVGGVFEGRFMDAVEMNEIATIPSMQVLRGMFVNVINAPIQGFVSVLNQIAEKQS